MSDPLDDQIQAAERTAENFFSYFEVVTGAEREHNPFDADRTSKVSLAYQKWEALEPEDINPCCEHLHSPEALLGLLAVPGNVWCPMCFVEAGDVWIDTHATSCDACGKDSKWFTEVAIKANGLITVMGWVCDECTKEAKSK